jgi:hypothetical protein
MKEQCGVNQAILWFYHEFFYSNYDRKYFEQHLMRDVYQYLEFKAGEVTYRTHVNVIKSLPMPKLFNDEFINQEKVKLEEFRNACRQSNTKNVDMPLLSSLKAASPPLTSRFRAMF